MNFDPAIAAQTAFRTSLTSGQLGVDSDLAVEAEEIFSSGAGSEAKAAYATLKTVGSRHPDAQAFQEFLIYSTWQQVTEEPIAEHFQTGLDLCARYLIRFKTAGAADERNVKQVLALQESYRAGLGLAEEDEHEEEHEKDVFKGGD